MVEISILLYVHNCENFLKESLHSLINQTFSDFEIFCIDDESDDDSLEILDSYSKKDARIRFVSIKYMGFSKAMNKAMSFVDGKYIYIMKPSTFLKFNALDILYNHAEKTESDIIFTDVNYQYENMYYNKSDSIYQIQQNISNQVFNYKELNNLIFSIDPSLENKFYRLKFIKNGELKFSEDLKYPEYLFFYNSLLSADKISYVQEFLFDYKKPFEFLKRDEIKIGNIFKEYDLILKKFSEINEFAVYKHYFLELKLSFFMREYSRIKEDYKENFFNIFRNDLIDTFLSGEFEDESIEFLSDFNRKIFEQILISENIYEFYLLRKNLFITTEFNNIINRKAFLKSVHN
ncbi:glycosyltransferase [uncultured Methanobrevibacter sp.]|uniref:glycosyltransferase n=1 Tax=uncultured Methanobrevibacter sp. TaxID=253161 RepID=UPI0025E2FA6B|nr:glycosyltransferase [uncultured Methanobrevibacter sp.]